MEHIFDRHEDVNATIISHDLGMRLLGSSNSSYSSFLHEAVKVQDSVKSLLKHSADVYKRDYLGFTPLALAVKYDDKVTAQELISHDIHTLHWMMDQLCFIWHIVKKCCASC